jgi:hypothetical protein
MLMEPTVLGSIQAFCPHPCERRGAETWPVNRAVRAREDRDTDDPLELADEIHARQPNLLASILVLPRYGHGKPVEHWEVVLQGPHDAHIDWSELERNQTQLAVNAYGRVDNVKSGRAAAVRCSRISCAARVVAAV